MIRRTHVGGVLARSATPQQAIAIDSRFLCRDENDSSPPGFFRILRSLQISPTARNELLFVVRSACVPQRSQTNWILSFPPAASASRICMGVRQLGHSKWRKSEGCERLCGCGIGLAPSDSLLPPPLVLNITISGNTGSAASQHSLRLQIA